jgi:hypothetical protein
VEAVRTAVRTVVAAAQRHGSIGAAVEAPLRIRNINSARFGGLFPGTPFPMRFPVRRLGTGYAPAKPLLNRIQAAMMGERKGRRSCAPAHRTGDGLGSIRASPAVVPPGWPPCHDSDDTALSGALLFWTMLNLGTKAASFLFALVMGVSLGVKWTGNP